MTLQANIKKIIILGLALGEMKNHKVTRIFVEDTISENGDNSIELCKQRQHVTRNLSTINRLCYN